MDLEGKLKGFQKRGEEGNKRKGEEMREEMREEIEDIKIFLARKDSWLARVMPRLNKLAKEMDAGKLDKEKHLKKRRIVLGLRYVSEQMKKHKKGEEGADPPASIREALTKVKIFLHEEGMIK